MTVIEILSGQQIGQYQLHELLGTGGMSAVYHAYQPSLERHVAIKILSRAFLDDPTYLQRFIQEAKTVAYLEHPHIVPIYDYGTQDDISYIVMRLLTGGTLEQRLDNRIHHGLSLPSLGEVSVLLRQLASALEYAHAHGVIHRDIKSGNVIFDQQGTAYLVDFGIAKLIHNTAALTTDGSILGTPSYMSPEQWRREPLTPAADQYSLAVLVYLLVAGRLPYSGNTYLDLMREHIASPLPPIPKLPRTEINWVLNRALAKSPQQRFPSVSTFEQAFAESIRGLKTKKTNFFNFLPLNYHTVSLPPDADIRITPQMRPANRSLPEGGRSIGRRTCLIAGLVGLTIGLLVVVGSILSGYLIFNILPSNQVVDITMTTSRIMELPTYSPILTPVLQISSSTVEAISNHQTVTNDQAIPAQMKQIGELSIGMPIRSVAISPDGTHIASGGGDGFVRIWDRSSQTQQGAFPAGEDVIYSVVFSPDSTLLAAGCGDGLIRLWELATGTLIRSFSSNESEVRSLAFDTDGQRLVSVGLDRMLHIWDTVTGVEQAVLKGHADRILSVAFSPDGTKLASGSQDNSIIIWNSMTQAEILKLQGHTGEVRDIAFSRDGLTIASASTDDTVKLWDVNTGQLLMSLEGQGQDQFSVAYSPNGQYVASGGRDNLIRVWNTQTGIQEAVLQKHEGWVFDLAFSLDGSILASASGDGTIRLWGN